MKKEIDHMAQRCLKAILSIRGDDIYARQEAILWGYLNTAANLKQEETQMEAKWNKKCDNEWSVCSRCGQEEQTTLIKQPHTKEECFEGLKYRVDSLEDRLDSVEGIEW